MAANMFIVNEMKATENENDRMQEFDVEQLPREEEVYSKDASSLKSVLNFVLSWENTINLIGWLALSGANNYLKLWDYNAGSYCNLRIGCLGWRTKKFFDIVQVGINLNLGRGICWSFLGAYNVIKAYEVRTKHQKLVYLKPLHVSFLVATNLSEKESMQTIAIILSFLLQGFVSVPLAIHISNFSISISLDSMIWMGIGKFLELKVKEKELGKKGEKK